MSESRGIRTPDVAAPDACKAASSSTSVSGGGKGKQSGSKSNFGVGVKSSSKIERSRVGTTGAGAATGSNGRPATPNNRATDEKNVKSHNGGNTTASGRSAMESQTLVVTKVGDGCLDEVRLIQTAAVNS